MVLVNSTLNDDVENNDQRGCSMGVSKIRNLGFSKSMDLQWVLSDATNRNALLLSSQTRAE